MKKYILPFLAICAAAIAGCSKSDDPAALTENRVVKVSASASSVTKVYGTEKGKFVWQKGDVIGVWTGSEMTAFTLDDEWADNTYGTFTGTLPEGGKIDENSYAVYPNGELSADPSSKTLALNEYSQWDFPSKNIRVFAKPEPAVTGTTTVADYKFQHISAYFRVTLKNVPVAAKAFFIESTKQLFLKGGSVDVSGDSPVLTPVTNDWVWVAIPDHTTEIASMTIYIPAVPAVYDNCKFRIVAYESVSFSAATHGDYSGWLPENTTIAAGDYYVFPAITFEGPKSDDTGSGINDGIEQGVVIDTGDGFWSTGR